MVLYFLRSFSLRCGCGDDGVGGYIVFYCSNVFVIFAFRILIVLGEMCKYSPKFTCVTFSSFFLLQVQFKRLIFHLESPAGLIFPKVARPDPLRCHHTSLFEAYRRHVLQVSDGYNNSSSSLFLFSVSVDPPLPYLNLR